MTVCVVFKFCPTYESLQKQPYIAYMHVCTVQVNYSENCDITNWPMNMYAGINIILFF